MEFFNSDATKAANMPFSQAVRAGDTLYLSGHLGNVPGKFELVPGGIEAESRQTMDAIGATLKLAGASFGDIVKCVVYLADLKEWGAFNKVYTEYFPAGRFPARTAVGVKELVMGARVEVECWAWLGKS
ncbi:MAG TPA: RidA family protein [Rhizomicrobium sp.]|jgi:reactive intermediate/imine deaminase